GLAAAGGFAVTWSALLRIFPGVAVLALGAKTLLDGWRGGWRGVDPAIARFVVGCVVAVALLVPMSFFVVGGGIRGGVDAWQEFAANSRKHLSTPLTNNMGLKTVVEFNPKAPAAVFWASWVGGPADMWVAARRRVSEERRTIVWVARVLLALVVLSVAARQ